jgi:hypothetical protein
MSRVRAPARPGGAALQMDVLELSAGMEALRVQDGRLKAALDDMQTRAVRPDLENAALKVTNAADKQASDYCAFRRAIVTGVSAIAAAPAGEKSAPPAEPLLLAEGEETPNEASSAVDPAPYLAVAPHVIVLPPASGVDIPFVLDAARCDGGSVGCRLLSSVFARCPAPLKRLAYLDLSHASATDTGTSFTPLYELVVALTSLPALRFLSLAGTSMGGPGGEVLRRLLRTLPSLTHLDVSDCSLGAQGAEELLGAFPVVPAEVADAAPAGAEEEEDPEVAAIIAAAKAAREEEQGLKKKKKAPTAGAGWSGGTANTSLLWLDISGNNLCSYGLDPLPAARLVRALLGHPSLQHLNLARNRLGEAAIVPPALVRGVAANASLRSLVLDENSLDAAPAAAIAAALESNSVLTHLSLRSNRVRSDGASAFASLLRCVTMGPWARGEEGARPPAPGLQCLDVRDNYIGPIGRSDLRLALEGCPPPPEVSRARGLGEGPLEDEEVEEGGSVAEGRGLGLDRAVTEDTGAEPGSVVLSRPCSAAVSESDPEGSMEESGRSSRLGDPTPPRSGAFTGVRAVLALRDGAAGEVGSGETGEPVGEPAGTSGEGSGEEGDAPPPVGPPPPKVVQLEDGSLANRCAHRVYLTFA